MVDNDDTMENERLFRKLNQLKDIQMAARELVLSLDGTFMGLKHKVNELDTQTFPEYIDPQKVANLMRAVIAMNPELADS
jgi:hypothetical protein